MKGEALDGVLFGGLAGMPGAFAYAVRATADPKRFATQIEFFDGPTARSVSDWAVKRMVELRADPAVVRAITGGVTREFRRKQPTIFVDAPINGHAPDASHP